MEKRLAEYTGICMRCNKQFKTILKDKRYTPRCCSRRCANSKVKTESTKLKLKERAINNNHKKVISLKEKYQNNPEIEICLSDDGLIKKFVTKKCTACSSFFKVLFHNKTNTCSNACYKTQQSVLLKGKTGGPREGGGRGKHSKFLNKKGEIVHCQSTYELKLCEILDELNLNWKRNLKGFKYTTKDGKIRNYYPDFYVENFNCFIETKGFLNDETKHKMRDSNVPRLILLLSKRCGGCWEDVVEDPLKLVHLMSSL
jgi:hypothetical protein